MIVTFTDFGAAGPYTGQMMAAMAAIAPQARLIDLVSNAPQCNPKSAAYLLAALAGTVPQARVVLAVVDPGVGGERPPLVIKSQGRYFVGPGNGLFELLLRRQPAQIWEIRWRPDHLAATFHGRDLFAPIAAHLEMGARPEDIGCIPASSPRFPDWPDDLAEVIYGDAYGNLMTGVRAEAIATSRVVIAGESRLRHARHFSALPIGEAFWYENSCGLVELAVNQGQASAVLGIELGCKIAFTDEFTEMSLSFPTGIDPSHG